MSLYTNFPPVCALNAPRNGCEVVMGRKFGGVGLYLHLWIPSCTEWLHIVILHKNYCFGSMFTYDARIAPFYLQSTPNTPSPNNSWGSGFRVEAFALNLTDTGME